MKLRHGNDWTYSLVATVPTGQAVRVAVNIGLANDLEQLKMRVHSTGTSLSTHVLRLYEGSEVANTDDPETGRNRCRRRAEIPPECTGTEEGDIYLFHGPAQEFTVGEVGLLLAERIASTAGHADLGEWLLSRDAMDAGRYYLLEIVNLSPDEQKFNLVVDYNFVDQS